MNAIRLAITDEVEMILNELKRDRYSVLNAAEILKLGLSLLYANHKKEKIGTNDSDLWQSGLPVLNISSSQKKSISKARKGKFIKMDSKKFANFLDK